MGVLLVLAKPFPNRALTSYITNTVVSVEHNFLSLLHTYLNNQMQVVNLNNMLSVTKLSDIGVAHGYILGALASSNIQL